MDKAVAQKEAIRLWRDLPVLQRATHKQAVAFAAQIAPQIQFESFGDHRKIVEGWLVREFFASDAAIKPFRTKVANNATQPPRTPPPRPVISPKGRNR